MKLFAPFAIALLIPLAFVGAASAAAPTPVLLGNAGLFAVLAGSGITNTGPTTIVGDVGSDPTPTQTGFASVSLTGANHIVTDAVTLSAKADLTTAYNTAAGQSPTLIPTELAGNTYTAGVYNSASGTFGMTGTLVLDGGNNADSIFIFQTGSTLITGGTGNVTFLRGAQACNVFWQVGSSATLGAGSNFSGTILANTSISVGGGVTVQGRLLAGEQPSGAGAVTLINDTIVKPTTCVTQAQNDAATAAAAALVQAQAAAAAKAAADSKTAADQAAAAALAAQVAATAQAAADTKAAAAAAAATAAKRVAAKKATAAKVKAKKAATAKKTTQKLTSIRTSRTHAGFTG